jgi:hypothetical protein
MADASHGAPPVLKRPAAHSLQRISLHWGIRLSRPRPATPSRLGKLPRPVQCLVDEGQQRGLKCISILPVRLG